MRLSYETEVPALTAVEQDSVRREVSRIVEHSTFKNSERSTKLLRYIVEAALSEGPVHLKERTIGHEVFGRAAGYDTGSDPVVRNAASEIRKRLAQYYQATNHEQVVHIKLVPGSYTPEFHFAGAPIQNDSREESVSLPTALAPPLVQNQSPPSLWDIPKEGQPSSSRRPAIKWAGIVAAVLICIGLATFAIVTHQQSTGIQRFWGPVFSSKREVVIAIGHQPANQAVDQKPAGNPTVALVDATSYATILGLMEVHEQRSRMLTSESITYDDLRDHPVVLIGGFNNEWTLRLTSGLRYRFGRENNDATPHMTWIEDTMLPDKPRWQVRWTPNFKDWTVDYAIAGRVKDPSTGGPVYYAAGVGSHATQAAAQFITQEKYLSQLPKSLSNPDKNIEIVLKMDVLNGTTGPPQVAASYVW